MKRIAELEKELNEKLAKLLPGGYYEEYGNMTCGNKIIVGPHVTVCTTLERVPKELKLAAGILLNKYLCNVKFFRRTVGRISHQNDPTYYTHLIYRKGKKNETR